MTMPIDLVLVRHGESEGNIAVKRLKRGDPSAYTEEFLKRHTSKWRLTDKGRMQAMAAGEWIRANIGERFDRYYVSEYLRAMETAGLLGLPGAQWYHEFQLRERDWGDFDVMPPEERMRRYAETLQRFEMDSFFQPPPNGESMAKLCERIYHLFDTLHRECAMGRVIIVCHGEVMWAFRVRLERMTQRRYNELEKSNDPADHIYNCQVIHYTRRNPKTGELAPHLDWMRSVCPTDPALSRNTWEPIVRTRFSNEELLAEVERTPRLIAG